VTPPCPQCDPPEASLLRLRLIGVLFCADDLLLLALANVMQQYGLLPLTDEAEASAPAMVRARKATRHALRRSGGDDQ
jgi:hypothetical protein